MGNPWDSLFSALKRSGRTIRVEDDLYEMIEEICREEDKEIGPVVSGLLLSALNNRNATEDAIAMWSKFTTREQDVAKLVCKGLTGRQIAQELRISPQTVKTHVTNIFGKCAFNSRGKLRIALASFGFDQ